MASKLNQCISVTIQNQIDHCDETKKEYSWLIPHCKPELKEITSWTTGWRAYVKFVSDSEEITHR